MELFKGFLMGKLKKISEDYLLKRLHRKAMEKSLGDDKGRIEVLEELIIQLYTLYQISKSLSVATQLDEIFNESMDLIDGYMSVHEYCLFMIDENKNELSVKACHGFDEGEVEDVVFKLGEGITGSVAKNGESILIRDVAKDERYMHYKGKKTDVGSFLSIPLTIKKNEVIGVINIHKKEIDSFTQSDVELFTEIAYDLANAIEKAKVYEETKELSMRDDLTSLYNRRYCNDNLEKEFIRAKRYGRTFSVIMIDIDNFKMFNDTNGHIKGDEALILTANILKENVRKSDVVARYGGEEFIVLLPEIDHNGVLKAAENLRKAVEEAKYFNEDALPTGKFTITAGVATYPEKAESIIDLIDYADKALYAGKALGRNIVCA